MDENSKINEKSTDNLIYNDQNESVAKQTSENEVNNMRLILPAFIQNERKYSQTERRKIQSSPIKSKRRYSQDSDYLSRQLNVSRFLFSVAFISICCV